MPDGWQENTEETHGFSSGHFGPGGDYKDEAYPEGCTVVDNPPFSILAEIQKFYLDRNIKFFLFAPELTAFSGKETVMRVNHIFADCGVTYQNGAKVRTAFVTNLSDGIVAETAPDLAIMVQKEMDRLARTKKKELPKYDYPDEIITAAMLGKYAKRGVTFRIRAEDCTRVSALDEQRKHGKAIFGGGLLLSERAARERRTSGATEEEKTGARKWQLSEREKEIVKGLGK